MNRAGQLGRWRVADTGTPPTGVVEPTADPALPPIPAYAFDQRIAWQPPPSTDGRLQRHVYGAVRPALGGITREATGLTQDKFIPGLSCVRSGVVQLAELQRQGFDCIKVE